MCTKYFLRESWSWSSFFSSSGADFQRTMTICAARLLRGNLGHGHRLFLSHQTPESFKKISRPDFRWAKVPKQQNKGAGRGRGPQKSSRKFVSESGRFRVQISLWKEQTEHHFGPFGEKDCGGQHPAAPSSPGPFGLLLTLANQ